MARPAVISTMVRIVILLTMRSIIADAKTGYHFPVAEYVTEVNSLWQIAMQSVKRSEQGKPASRATDARNASNYSRLSV
jgi:hypothetical protein